ncbi:MAG: tRNA (guanosine(37)-N1)-methyltransferase TrmD [Alphaproteobacteria bacterium]|nr:tRNA (guanosine(37)-N1)-methyltransferase TrmD [Alphaproteobacteria bacterium]
MSSSFQARVLTVFPEMFPGYLGYSLAGRALNDGIWSMDVVNIRDFASDKHRTVDDTPFGGGAGMIMRPDILGSAIEATYKPNEPLIYFSPRGERISQSMLEEVKDAGSATFLCGRFEGIDERVLEAYPFREVSLGDFVLSGGEPACLAMMDGIVRLLPGVMGSPESLDEESFSNGLLEYPQYTRPAVWNGLLVPEVLNSGHHENIAKWRLARSQELTKQRRPDMWNAYLENTQARGLKK